MFILLKYQTVLWIGCVKMKKALMVATVFKFLNFEKSDMAILKEKGYEVHTATNMRESDWLKDDGSLDYLKVKKHQIDFGRTPFSKQSFIAYTQLKKLLKKEKFDVIHCHTPVAAAITRLAAHKSRKQGTKIIYTSHGFHFHKTSGKKNWFIYYPIEYIMAFLSDMIITINKEDYKIIQRFHVKQKRYIPGVGVNVKYIAEMQVDRLKVRKRFGLPQDGFIIVSVGELSERKNHEVIIRAIAESDLPNLYYIICGEGERRSYLESMIENLGMGDRVILAGQQSHEEVLELYHASDVGALPSLIEGLGLAGIETLAAGKPLVASGVHGIKDYVINQKTGIRCNPTDPKSFCLAIEEFAKNRELYEKCCIEAKKIAFVFDIEKVKRMMKENYELLNL